MRFLTLERQSPPRTVLDAFGGEGPLEIELVSKPDALSRLALVSAVASADAPLRVRFRGRLATPLTEVACLCGEGTWGPGSRLDFAGALLVPLVRRAGSRTILRLLIAGKTEVDPSELLLRSPERQDRRSPLAIRMVSELITDPGSPALGLALEKAAFRLSMAAPDRGLGVQAFRARRAPSFPW